MTECVHRWKIKPPNGPTSEGRCTRCHERKEFRNSLDTDPFTGGAIGKGRPRSRKDIHIAPPSEPTRVL